MFSKKGLADLYMSKSTCLGHFLQQSEIIAKHERTKFYQDLIYMVKIQL